jgi:hypothetical protein
MRLVNHHRAWGERFVEAFSFQRYDPCRCDTADRYPRQTATCCTVVAAMP